MIDEDVVKELLRLNGDRLYHREGQELEFKEQFSLSALADYFRDFAAFANNRGGYLIFGVKDAPRALIGMSDKSKKQFEKVDPEMITGFLLKAFSSNIEWDQAVITINEMDFGVFRVLPAEIKPVIARKDEGKNRAIKNGEVYYRYGGRTQKIQSAELDSIINRRIEENNQQWIDLMSKIGRAGPQNSAILDTEKALIEKGDSRIMVIDEGLASKLKFIRKGEFVEKDGAAALQLTGDVVPVDKVEVVKRVKESLTKNYPLSALELSEEVKKKLPEIGQNAIWKCIRENDLKNNLDYSAYNFRNKKQEDDYRESGKIPSAIPSIYNHAAVEFLVKVLGEKGGDS